jgi:hypothetical protein
MNRSPAANRQLLLAGGVGLVLLVATAGLPYNHFTDPGGGGDMILYERFATSIFDGLLPYHEFFFEYPPAAIVPMLVPKLTGLTYAVAFRGTMLVLLAATLGLVLLTLRRLHADSAQVWGGALLMGASPLLLGPVLFERFDAWPAFLLSLAVLLIAAERIALGAAALAVAVCAKVYPAAAVPALFIYALAIRTRAVVGRAIAAGVAAGLVIVLPFAIIGFGGLGFSFYVQFKRPLQIETLGASILLAADRLGLYTADVQPGFARELGGTLPQVVALASTAVQLAAILASAWWLARGSRSAVATTTAVAAAVAAFITFGKVLSPQYVVWLIPLVPLVARQVWVKAMLAMVAAMALTNVYFPWHYGGITHVTSWVWVLLVRNIALTALTLFLLLELRAGALRRPSPDCESPDDLAPIAE